MDKKISHLQMIQSIIGRMAQNSFTLKGWSVTLVSGLLALSTSVSDKPAFRLIALLPLMIFWILDGYFLDQERQFRKLYDAVRIKKDDHIDFAMKLDGVSDSWLCTLFSKTLVLFHFALLIGTIAVVIFLWTR
jgi:hypothetical protein